MCCHCHIGAFFVFFILFPLIHVIDQKHQKLCGEEARSQGEENIFPLLSSCPLGNFIQSKYVKRGQLK